MTNPLSNFKKEAQKIRLSQSEKARMLSNIVGAASAGVSRRTPSPYQYHYSWFSVRFAMPVALVIIVALGSGTVYAAQGSLPGDVLYPVKVSVAEPLEGALALSTQAKAKFNASLVEERMQEAEALASQGRLTSSTTQEIESSLSEHAAAVNDLAQQLQNTDPGTAAEVTAQVDSSLAAHSAVIAQLGDDSKNESTKINSNAFATRIAARIHTAFEKGEGGPVAMAFKATAPTAKTFAAFSGSSSESTSTSEASSTVTETSGSSTASSSVTLTPSDEALQRQARKIVTTTRELFASVQSSLDASTTAQIETRLDQVDTLISQGDFKNAFEQALELSVYLNAQKKFDKNILRSLLKHQNNDDSTTTESEKGDDSIQIQDVHAPDVDIHL
jgi:hypothetical protein